MYIWIIIGIVVLLLIVFIAVYNGFITLKNRTKEAWSDIDVQLKRRYDLIPNLVETVKGYAKQEKDIFIKVTEARASAMTAKGVEEKGKAENVLTDALKSIFAVAENYPTLRSSENFQKLQDELTDTENKIEAARRFYNGNVRDYNTALEKFPNNILASVFNFKQFDLFEVENVNEKQTPKVKFE